MKWLIWLCLLCEIMENLLFINSKESINFFQVTNIRPKKTTTTWPRTEYNKLWNQISLKS